MRSETIEKTVIPARSANIRASVLMIALAVVALAPQSASAVRITVDGGAQFYDNFEGVTPTGGDDDPVAIAGSWTVYEKSPEQPAAMQVTSGGDPISNNQLRVTDQGYVRAQTGNQGVSGDLLYATFWAYFPSGKATINQISLNQGPSGADAWGVEIEADGDVREWLTNADTGLNVTFDTWQQWEFTRTQGDVSGGTLTINSNSASLPMRPGYEDKILGAVYFDVRGGDVLYLDSAIPAPAPTTLALVGLGLLLTAMCRRSRQV